MSEYTQFLEDLTKLQNGACAICAAPGKLVLDHDHQTGFIRGWLCQPCNLEEPGHGPWRGDHWDEKDCAVCLYLAMPPVVHLKKTMRYQRTGRIMVFDGDVGGLEFPDIFIPYQQRQVMQKHHLHLIYKVVPARLDALYGAGKETS